ncbi:MAG: YjbQ family protein [Acidimicrobiia bacterium]|nr:YjbQ family protein [Acidimicrobiia bacterium]RZV46096.1 MAG: YjbQ family protein [Acidimicrobiia bacterium]
MDTELIQFHTGSETEAVDITGEVAGFVAGKGDGIVQVFCPHATAGVALIETGAGSDADLLDIIDHVLPPDFAYRHRHGSPGHGADHVLPAFIAPSITIPVIDGRMQLGTWQSVVFVDPNRDNPNRTIRLSFLRA